MCQRSRLWPLTDQERFTEIVAIARDQPIPAAIIARVSDHRRIERLAATSNASGRHDRPAGAPIAHGVNKA
jgi:hypothetical protein